MPDAQPLQIVPPPRDLSAISAARIGSEVGPLLDELLERAGNIGAEGSASAAETLLALLTNAVGDFERLCDQAPERFHGWAREREDWPMLQHKHPGLTRRTLALVERLELGRHTELNCLHKSFDPDIPANRVVLDLFYGAKFYQMNGRAPARLVVFGEVASEETKAKLDAWCREIGPTLPRLSRETWKEWDEKTRLLFLIHQGEEFQDRPHLATLAHAVKEKDRHGKPSRAHRRTAILKAVSGAWRSISAFLPEG